MDRRTTDVVLHSAGPIGSAHVPVLRIVAATELTDKELDDAYQAGRLQAFYQQEGRALQQALCRHLPGGTIDQLLVALLEHHASLLVVPYVEPLQVVDVDSKACINCAHMFTPNDVRGYYGARAVGPFCERCYTLIKTHEEPDVTVQDEART